MDLHDLVAARARTHSRDAAAGQVLQTVDVVLGLGRELVEALGTGDVLAPARQLLVYRLG